MSQQPPMGQGLLFVEASRLHSVRYITLGTSDQPDVRDLYLPTHTTLTTDRHPCPLAGFESTIPASERPQTHALDRAATAIGCLLS